ncbi:MAG: hypothetical protein ACR2O4_17915 [Hyphomicrobiaceae bacterium]
MSTPGPRRVFEIGEGRKTILSFVFLVLLPFLVSLPVMVFIRSIHGFWGDAASAAVLATLFACWMLFLLVNIVSAFRTRIELSDDKVALSVPRWRGPNPGLRYTRADVPLEQIEAVETRGEIYRAIQVPVLTRATSLVKRDGERITLGYVNDDAPDPALPYPRIGEMIAERAGVPYVDRGNIYAGNHVRAMASGPPAWDAPTMSEGDYAEYKRNHSWAMVGLAIMLFGLAGIGLFVDLYRSGWIVPGG